MKTYFPFIIIGLTILCTMPLALYLYHNQKQRTLALKQVAPQLGLKFKEAQENIPTAIRQLLGDPSNKQFCNLLHGYRDNYELLVFDYSYLVGKNTVTQTVFALNFTGTNLLLPKFMLRPWQMSDILKKRWLDYEFVELPNRYKNHVLIVFENKANVQAIVDSHPATLWKQMPIDQHWLSDGNWFLCYKGNQVIPAEFLVLNNAIGRAVHDCQQLSLGRVKSAKMKL